MRLSIFHDKLNKVGNNSYAVEENITMPETGVYDANLYHDNINDDTVQVYTGPSLTGNPVGYVLSTPADMPWKRRIRIETNESTVYITYETIGDQVEAEDVNEIYSAITTTQNAVTSLEEEITGSTSGYTWNRLMGISADSILDIVTQPEDCEATAGVETTIEIEVNGVNPHYQWQYVEAGESTWINFTGGTEAILEITPTASWDGRRIRCVVTNNAGATVISNTVTLTVT